MASAVEIVELIGVKSQGAVGRKVQRKDGRRGPSIQEQGCKTRRLLVKPGVPVHLRPLGFNLRLKSMEV